MTKQEYLNQLKNELVKQGVADAEDVVTEYEQHFAFKLADGFGGRRRLKKSWAPPPQSLPNLSGCPERRSAKAAEKRSSRYG